MKQELSTRNIHMALANPCHLTRVRVQRLHLDDQGRSEEA